VIEALFIVQYEVNLSELAEMASIRKCLLCNLLEEACSNYILRLLSQWRINKFHLRTNNMVKAYQKYVLDFLDVLRLKLPEKLLGVLDITCIE
jgi:hypothetical protein